jgi:putative ABC transport system permease protein
VIPSETLRMAAASLWGHRTRSLLTILGVVIGVGSVLAVVTMGASFKAAIVGEFGDVDTRTVFVTVDANRTGPHGGPPSTDFADAFTSRDAQELARLDGVEAVTPTATLQTAGLRLGDRLLPLRGLTATLPTHQAVRPQEGYADGGPFLPGSRQIVLSDALARELGNGTPVPAGTPIQVLFQGRPPINATVAGVLLPEDSPFGGLDSGAYVPLQPFYDNPVQSPVSRATVQVYSGLQVLARDASQVEAVRDRVKAYLEGPGSDAGRILPRQARIVVATQGDITAQISAAFDQVTLFIGAIAVVSLVVGAIGIANIMLVSVTERTAEIGILKALGARDGAILRLFLAEAAIIGLLGSLIGIGLGLGLGWALVRGLLGETGVGVVMPWDWTLVSLGVGLLVGVVAGIMPARRATKVDPVEALARHG